MTRSNGIHADVGGRQALASRKDAHEWYARGMRQQFKGLLERFCADGSDAVMFARTRARA